jgi:RNA polymerase sigma factor (sigma-70 family)
MDNISESDDDLIRACRDGDAHAWDRLLHKYERLVFSIPLNYGLSREDAADITQLTFVSLIQNLETFREGSRLGAWLALVARRNTWRVIERARHESVGEYEELADSIQAIAIGDANPIERWELTEWLNNGLLMLNKRCRDLLLALYFETSDPSYSEVAARIGMPVGSVGPTRARCLERLKQILRHE